VSRIIAASALGVIGLTISPFGLSQTGPNQNSLNPNRDRRLEDALADVALLKRVVKEQDRRIADLEKTVKALQAVAAVSPEKPAGEERLKPAIKPFAARWRNPLAWTQLKEGMSRAQVEEILGKPVSVDSVIDYQTLYYKSDASSSDALAGIVKLTDDRVTEAIPPNF
jgi:SmpA / OmlA family